MTETRALWRAILWNFVDHNQAGEDVLEAFDSLDRLDLDSYLSWMRIDGDRILHLGCRLTPEGARLAAERLRVLADEIEGSA
jgi:hypothetical protein